MKNLTSRKIEMYLDYIELYPTDELPLGGDLYISRHYLNKMVTITQTNYEDVETFLKCYFKLQYPNGKMEVIGI